MAAPLVVRRVTPSGRPAVVTWMGNDCTPPEATEPLTRAWFAQGAVPAGAAPSAATKARASTSPAPHSSSTPVAPASRAEERRAALMVAGLAPGTASSPSATTPATKGVAMEVPDIVVYEETVFAWAATTLSPGAATSGLCGAAVLRVGPRLEKPARYSEVSVSDAPARPDGSDAAPTVTASVATPGDEIVPGASPELPAATTTTFPARNAAFTAWLPASEPSDAGLPSDIEMTCTSGRAAHHSIAETTFESAPEPVESSTLAATTRAPGATPAYAAFADPVGVPVAMPATWVPCPWSS